MHPYGFLLHDLKGNFDDFVNRLKSISFYYFLQERRVTRNCSYCSSNVPPLLATSFTLVIDGKVAGLGLQRYLASCILLTQRDKHCPWWLLQTFIEFSANSIRKLQSWLMHLFIIWKSRSKILWDRTTASALISIIKSIRILTYPVTYMVTRMLSEDIVISLGFRQSCPVYVLDA